MLAQRGKIGAGIVETKEDDDFTLENSTRKGRVFFFSTQLFTITCPF
jgi:hypothetical protein